MTHHIKSIASIVSRHAELIRRLKSDHSDGGKGRVLTAQSQEIATFVADALAAGAILEDDTDRMAAQTIIDYWSNLLRRGDQPAPDGELEPFDASKPERLDVACPYSGDEPILNGERLFGRDSEIASVLAKLERGQIALIRGPGGCGKSSLLFAGVLPRVAAGEPTLVTMRPGTKPLDRLAKSLTQVLGRPIERSHLREAGDLAHLLEERSSAVLAIDQFEDFFVLASDSDRSEFDKLISHYLEARSTHKLVLCINDGLIDHFEWMTETHRRIDRALMVEVAPLGAAALEQAIVRPAGAVDLGIGAGVVEHIIRQLLGDPAALPLLQFSMVKLWAMPERKNRLTLGLLDKVGELRKAFEHDAKARYDAACAVGPAPALQQVLLALVRVDARFDYHRRPCRLDRLPRCEGIDTGAAVRILDEHGFVRIVDDEFVELHSEAYLHHWPHFIDLIKSSRTSNAILRDWLRDRAYRWDRAHRPRSGLLRRAQLDEVGRPEGLTDLEKLFLNASEAAIDAKRRRARVAIGIVALFVVVTLVLMVLSLRGQRDRLDFENDWLKFENDWFDAKNNWLRAKDTWLDAKDTSIEVKREEVQLEAQMAKQPTVAKELEPEVLVTNVADERAAGSYWLQVATDRSLEAAQSTLSSMLKVGDANPKFQIIHRGRYFVLMVGEFRTAEEARRFAKTRAAQMAYQYGVFVRELDAFCPDRAPTGEPPKYGAEIYRCRAKRN